ncbi:MAG: glycosyltransferase N-terminal domain-containing protein [Verrucomicrobiota bacterium]
MKETLARLLYNTAFLPVFVASMPYYGWRLWRRGQPLYHFEQRLGIYGEGVRKKLAGGADLWIHAVSVGEVMLAKAILGPLRQSCPGIRVVLTTTTQTGRSVALPLEDELTTVLYNPIDWYSCVESAYRLIRPRQLVLIEAEIWPNYLWSAQARGIPVTLVNARLSERTERRYRRLRWLVRPLLAKLGLVLAQDEVDVERLVGAGYPSESIFNLGSLKYDVAGVEAAANPAIEDWWSRCGWPGDRQVLLAASTHRGEEEAFLSLFQELRPKWPQLRLLLVPRHAERGRSILEAARRRGLRAVARSASAAWREAGAAGEEPEVIVGDTTGELKHLYAKADLAFVGKSLRARGGQNFLESVGQETPTLLGPNMQNFAVITRDFVRRDGVRQIADEADLLRAVEALLANEEERRALGRRGRETYQHGLGAAQRTAELLAASLAESQVALETA